MKNYPLFLIAALFSIFGFQSCQLDQIFNGDNEETESYNLVQTELVPYFKRFEQEGKTRGINVNLTNANISGIIADISKQHVIGQCSFNSQEPERVTIDLPFWNSATDLGKEFVVFHELGHCYLGRDHDESIDARGYCLSIMRSGTGNCRDAYNAVSRKNYLDELFNEDK